MRGGRSKEFIDKAERGLGMYMTTKLSVTKIAEIVGVTRASLSNYIKENGVELRDTSRKYTYNDNFFSKIDSEPKAYWLGFIYADGCVNESGSSKNIEITLNEEDGNHLAKFIDSVEGDMNVVDKIVKLNGKEITTKRVTICSTKMCNDLIEYGCTPRKSLTLEFPKIKSSLVKHFIRGYIDGDGCVQDPANKKRLSIVGTKSFLESMQTHFEEVLGVTKVTIRAEKRAKHFIYEKNGEQVTAILEYLYKGSQVYLDRKYYKALAYLSSN